MLIKEIWINKTENCINGDSDFYEPFTDDIGKLFKSCQREHGRCVSGIFIDTKNNGTIKIGWVFEKRQKYTDCDETYLAETWIELHKDRPTVTTKKHYLEF